MQGNVHVVLVNITFQECFVMSQRCYKSVTRELQECCNGVKRAYISRVSWNVARLFRGTNTSKLGNSLFPSKEPTRQASFVPCV
jgi:hypothetical protein